MLILDNPTTWPVHVIDQLNSNKVVQLCKSQDYMEHIAEHPDLIDIFASVEEFAISDGIAGYHCTKQPSNVSFKSIGLRSLDFARHHAEVRALIRQHPSVDDELYRHIDSKLTDWQYNHTGDRENKLWFCMTRTLVLDSGTDLFFKYFGGESVYFPFLDDKSVIPILESIGKSVVVEANINPADLFVFQWAFGRTLVSHFARTKNPNFFVEELEGYVTTSILPRDIMSVHSYEIFNRSF